MTGMTLVTDLVFHLVAHPHPDDFSASRNSVPGIDVTRFVPQGTTILRIWGTLQVEHHITGEPQTYGDHHSGHDMYRPVVDLLTWTVPSLFPKENMHNRLPGDCLHGLHDGFLDALLMGDVMVN